MILDTTLKLEAILAGAVSANQPEANVDFIDYGIDGLPSIPAPIRTALNSGTAVTILAAPVGGSKARQPIGVSIYNKDTASVTLTVRTNDGTTVFIIVKQVLLAGETLVYEKEAGWQIL